MNNIDFELKKLSDSDIMLSFIIFKNEYTIDYPCGDKLNIIRKIYLNDNNKINKNNIISEKNSHVNLKSCRLFVEILCNINILYKKFDKKNCDYNSDYYLTEYFDYITENNIISIFRVHKGLKNIIRLAKIDSLK